MPTNKIVWLLWLFKKKKSNFAALFLYFSLDMSFNFYFWKGFIQFVFLRALWAHYKAKPERATKATILHEVILSLSLSLCKWIPILYLKNFKSIWIPYNSLSPQTELRLFDGRIEGKIPETVSQKRHTGR